MNDNRQASSDLTKVREIQLVNSTNFHESQYDVEAHGAHCQYLGAWRRQRDLWNMADAGTITAASAHECWEEYNADFIDEGPDACWMVAVFPCTGLVKSTVEVSG